MAIQRRSSRNWARRGEGLAWVRTSMALRFRATLFFRTFSAETSIGGPHSVWGSRRIADGGPSWCDGSGRLALDQDSPVRWALTVALMTVAKIVWVSRSVNPFSPAFPELSRRVRLLGILHDAFKVIRHSLVSNRPDVTRSWAAKDSAASEC